MKSTEEKGKKFWNKFANNYSKKSIPNEAIYLQKITKTQEYLSKDSIILEIGCGTGTTALRHASYVKKIDAIDYSAEMIKIANTKKNNQKVKNVFFHNESITNYEFPKNHYNMIMAHSILHLTKENELILKKIHSSLQKDGLFVSSSACLKDTPLIRAILPIVGFFIPTPDVNIFSTQEYLLLHEKVGFEILYQWNFKKGEVFVIAKKI